MNVPQLLTVKKEYDDSVLPKPLVEGSSTIKLEIPHTIQPKLLTKASIKSTSSQALGGNEFEDDENEEVYAP